MSSTATSAGADSFGPGMAVFGDSSSVWTWAARNVGPGTAAMPIPLVDSDGNAGTVTAVVNRGGSSTTNPSPVGTFADLYDSFVNVATNVVVSGLPINTAATVILFCGGPAGANRYRWTVDGVSKTAVPTGNYNTLVEDDNYLRFASFTSAAGEITLTPQEAVPGFDNGATRFQAMQVLIGEPDLPVIQSE